MRDVLEFWVQLHSHPEAEVSFKFIPNILMSKECIQFFGPLCIELKVIAWPDKDQINMVQ
jgi:hypothetical protein